MDFIKCRNPECGALILPIRRRLNKSGVQQYHSMACCAKYPPKLFAVYDQVKKRFSLPEVLSRQAVVDMLNKLGESAGTLTRMAQIVRVSRSTMCSWIGKFGVVVHSKNLKKVVRPKRVLRVSSLKVGDRVARVVDPGNRIFEVVEKVRYGVMVKPVGVYLRSIFVHIRLLKLWKKLKSDSGFDA